MIPRTLSTFVNFFTAALIVVTSANADRLPVPVVCLVLSVCFLIVGTALMATITGERWHEVLLGMWVYFIALSLASTVIGWLSYRDVTIAVGTLVVFILLTLLYYAVIYWLGELIRGLEWDMQI